MTDSHGIDRQQASHQHEERCQALRALLMTPLMTSVHADFAAVRRHADDLRAWFARETGWALHIERDCARLYKRPADLIDASRGLPNYDRRRYVLLCLACAVLERADPQITLRVLGERLLALAAEPALLSSGFAFALQAQHERRELVAICRSLLELGVLQRVAGDEEGFVRSANDTPGTADALYDVQRRVLAGMLAAVRGPSTWAAEDAPQTLAARLASLVTEHAADSDEARRTALRHHLSRRLLDDPVVYLDSLEPELRAYFINQRGPMATRLCDATDLMAEQRAEGLALVDEGGALSDVAMPAEGTEAHVTLLVAGFLADHARAPNGAQASVSTGEITRFVADAKLRYGTYWRKSAKEPGAEHELARTALERLQKLQLVDCRNENENENDSDNGSDTVQPRPALARFAIGDTEIKRATTRAQPSLFDPT